MAKRVHICDDEPHVVSPLAFKFEAAGYDVDMTSQGEEAWKAIVRRPPELLITDIQMPELDGFGLVKRLRGDDEFRELPIILLTATTICEETRQFAEQWGVLRVVPKPYSPKELLAMANGLFATPT